MLVSQRRADFQCPDEAESAVRKYRLHSMVPCHRAGSDSVGVTSNQAGFVWIDSGPSPPPCTL